MVVNVIKLPVIESCSMYFILMNLILFHLVFLKKVCNEFFLTNEYRTGGGIAIVNGNVHTPVVICVAWCFFCYPSSPE